MIRARSAALSVDVECTARVDFNRNSVADIRAPVPGVVRSVLVDLGQQVKAQARLMVLESAGVGDLQGQLQAARQRVEAARANHARKTELLASQIASAREVELARQELGVAESRRGAILAGLRIAGASRSSRGGRYTLRAPIAGTVVRRAAIVGTLATAQTSLAMIADTAVMWALLDVREFDAGSVKLGQAALVRVDGLPNHTFTGRITWISSSVDRRTRRVSVRAEVKNGEGLLRANQFARATIRVAGEKDAVAVPRESVQRMGKESFVFVRKSVGLYEPRPVKLGRSNDRLVQVTGPVSVGDRVVTAGAFLLKTELSRESIGAGCCEVEGPKER